MNVGDQDAGPTDPPRPPAPPGPRTPVEMMTAQFAAMISQPGATSLIDRATDEQIDKMLDQADQAGIREDAYKTRVLYSLTFIISGAMALLFGLCFLFLKYEAKDSLEKIVALLLGLSGGGGVGFGLGRLTSRGSD